VEDAASNHQSIGEEGVDTRRRATAPAFFCLLTKRVFFSIGGNKDFIGVAI
jgi:hypothetical protein